MAKVSNLEVSTLINLSLLRIPYSILHSGHIARPLELPKYQIRCLISLYLHCVLGLLHSRPS